MRLLSPSQPKRHARRQQKRQAMRGAAVEHERKELLWQQAERQQARQAMRGAAVEHERKQRPCLAVGGNALGRQPGVHLVKLLQKLVVVRQDAARGQAV